MIDNPDETLEPVIGHHVCFKEKELGPIGELLESLRDERGIERRPNQFIRIEVGDVDWDETKEITLKLSTIRQILDYYDDER